MVRSLRKLFNWPEAPDDTGDDGQDRIQLSTAVLLVEIARADHDRQEIEFVEMRNQLAANFGLSEEASGALLEAAETAAENSVSLHEFTRLLHDQMTYQEKTTVIEMLWRIALADNYLDRYEDYMIGKIADLLYIARGDVIRLKSRVIDSR
jgi:uncharacterized tellurite resistance protein B-like protein